MADKISKEKEMAIILALARGDTGDEAAEACGVSPRTVFRVKAKPDSAIQIAAIRAELRSQVSGIIAADWRMAARELKKLLASEDERIRLGAIRTYFEHGIKIAENIDQAEEIAKLKEDLRKQGVSIS